jgi:hypothetical protein
MHRIVFAVPLLAAAAGCTSVASTGSKVIDTPSPGKAVSAAPSTPGASHQMARIGSTIELKDDNGQDVAVTVVKVVDPAPSAQYQIQTPTPGSRIVAVQFRITNKAPALYSDDPDADIVGIDSQGQQYQVEMDETGAGVRMNSGLKLPSGQSTLGYESFMLPTGLKLAKVQYQLEAGIGAGDIGQWILN